MRNEPDAMRPGDEELKAVLRAALDTPFDDVDWDRLHANILAGAGAHVRTAPREALDWVGAWSSRGVPLAAGALAAAVLAMLLLPLDARRPQPQPPGFWPVAEELIANLPEPTRRLLLAGDDVNSLLRAVIGNGGEERDIT